MSETDTKDKADAETFSGEQQRYLEGLVSGLQANRAAKGLKPLGEGSGAGAGGGEPTGPDAAHLKAQAATEAAGKKLVDPEKWKREEHPFDAYARLKDQADANEFPKPPDNFRWRYYGLFYVAPTQNSYMCRLRIPNGILSAAQLDGLARVAETKAGGYAHVTTRANLQIREIAAENAVDVVETIQDLGLCSRGSGADNIRNVTGTTTAGIDPQELLDTRPFAREWHYHILNDRSLTGLPRKFNVAFDGAGRVAVLEETNDIGFQAIEVMEGAAVPAGVYFRLVLGGITGHQDVARDTGIVLEPKQATRVADAIVRVFIENGDRTNRNKARLKYVLDAWGFETFLAAVEDKLGAKLARVDASLVKPRPEPDRLAHLGVHPQKQAGLNWIGLVLPVGKLTAAQMRAIAALARDLGDGDIRLTVWQNLIVSGVADDVVPTALQRIADMGLSAKATAIRAGLIACTGNTGCKFAAANTKGTAEAIAQHVEARLEVDQPVNIHLTGCHHSCAQHYVGDIGLIAAQVPVNDDGDTVEGFHIVVGGGTGTNARIGRELMRDVKKEDCPVTVERLLRAYLANRQDAGEQFFAFANRLETEQIARLMQEQPV
jgi:ferredoxin-nitrite reductase